VYELEGRRASGPALPRIKEIVRIDTPPQTQRTFTRKRKSRQTESDSSDDDDESDCGEVYTSVKLYPEDGLIDDYKVAVGKSAINPYPLQNDKVKYDKLFQDGEYTACGIMDIESGAEKGVKSTKHAFMSFVVMSGKVEVKIYKTAFVVGKGGVFVVPRGLLFGFCVDLTIGNLYSIKNVGDKPTRLFFSQSVEVERDAGGNGEDAE
jgi:centromere protein C